MSTRAVLETIRDYYKKNPDKWIKGRFQDNEGRFCLEGAITSHLNNGVPWKDWYPEFTECRNKLESLIGDSLVAWNDEPERTVEEVIALLDKAIENEKI